jgi:hypothetical protein
MSTVSTHLNWGASYLVNDLYRRFLSPTASDRAQVRASRVCTVLLFAASLLVTSQMSTIEAAWRLLVSLGAGSGLVLILRWVWWRINAWSEISAMAASIVASLVAGQLFVGGNEFDAQAKTMLFVVAVSTAVWLPLTLLTPAERDDVLRRFIERVRPEGAGWRAVYQRLGLQPEAGRGGQVALGFALGVVLVYTSVFSIGQLVLGPRPLGALLAAVAVAVGVGVWRLLPRLLSPR